MPGRVSDHSGKTVGEVDTVSSPLLHQSHEDTNGQSVRVSSRREERAPRPWLCSFGTNSDTDLMELMLNQLIMLVPIGMISSQNLQSFILPILRNQPPRTFRHEQQSDQLRNGEGRLQNTGDPPRPSRRHRQCRERHARRHNRAQTPTCIVECGRCLSLTRMSNLSCEKWRCSLCSSNSHAGEDSCAKECPVALNCDLDD